MKIYIASSWKNQHAVEMLTELFEKEEWEVLSFVRNNYGEGHSSKKPMDFEKWVNTDMADRSFEYDTQGAMNCDVCVYIAPSGKDAAAELGMAFAKGKPIIGLYAKGEDFGLMRKMITWVERYTEVIPAVKKVMPNPFACYGNKRPNRMDFDSQEEYSQRITNYEQFEKQRKLLN